MIASSYQSGAPDAPCALHADAPKRPICHATAWGPPPGRALEEALQYAAVRDQEQHGAGVRRGQPLHLCITCVCPSTSKPMACCAAAWRPGALQPAAPPV